MNHTRRGFLLAAAPFPLLPSSLAGAASHDDKALPGWGTIDDPDHDCQFEAASGSLRITVPGTLHDLSAEIGKLNAPRILREVEGDFLIDVRVEGGFRPAGPCTRANSLPYLGAGLLVWFDDKNYIRFERAALERNGKNEPYVNFELRREGRREGGGMVVPEAAAYLRLERRGDQVVVAHGPDGIQWAAPRALPVSLPRTVRMGVAAVSSSAQPFAARLDSLRLLVTAK